MRAKEGCRGVVGRVLSEAGGLALARGSRFGLRHVGGYCPPLSVSGWPCPIPPRKRRKSSPASAASAASARGLSAHSRPAPTAGRFCSRSRRSAARSDRKSVVEGQRVSVRGDIGGRRIIKKKNKHNQETYTTYTT